MIWFSKSKSQGLKILFLSFSKLFNRLNKQYKKKAIGYLNILTCYFYRAKQFS